MIEKDALVKAIFDALKKENASPEDRRLAIIRASHIAQAYMGETELLNAIFGA